MNSTDQTNSASRKFDSYSIVAALIDRIDDLVEHLGLDLEVEAGRFYGCCPIHKGNNPRAFSMYANSGSWRCYTHNCHEEMKPTLINLLSTVLGKSVRETFDWAVQFLDGKVTQIEQVDISLKKVEKIYGLPTAQNKKIDEMDKVRARMIIPSQYFVDRGFSAEILKQFDVGVAKAALPYNNPFFERVIVPVKDKEGELIGYTARSINNECPECGGYHNENLLKCPKDFIQPKWRHHSYTSGGVLYGLDTAKEEIAKTRKVLLCEGPPDLWKLREVGIKNSVAMFGHTIKDYQIFLLEQLGVYTIFSGQDVDEPGERGYNTTKYKCCHLFNVERLKPSGSHDWEHSDFTEAKEKLCQ